MNKTLHASELAAKVWRGESLPGHLRSYLRRQIREETSWAVRLVIAVTCAMMYLRRHDPRRSALACADASEPYRCFVRLARREKAKELPKLLLDYESWCVRTLAAFEPPIAPGKDPVRAIVRVARRLGRKRRARPGRVMDALDALITAGHAGPTVDIHDRVVRDIGRMLGATVILHKEGGRYRTLLPQSVHTLSTWTIRRIGKEERLRSFKVRPRPEFWQPEQRRPGGLLVFPIGDGVACIGRRRTFRRRERKAVRTVLRFLGARQAEERVPASSASRAQAVSAGAVLAGDGLIGASRAWRRVVRQVAKVAPAHCSVVLLGETGTGKEQLARAIHSASPRSQGPFVAVNCGAIAGDLMSSELFGHIRGAFTGAHRNRLGLVRRAHRGTLFLDEVAEMPHAMQVALLRVLEERVVLPVGSARPHKVDLRVLCATHKELREEVSAGRFREDLFHRLNVVSIRLPPLRDRDGDLDLLARHLLSRIEPTCRLHADAYAVLAEHPWPGNVRELDNVLRAAALLAEGPEITPEGLRAILERSRERRRPTRSTETLGPRAEAMLAALGARWLSSGQLARELGVSSRTVNRELRRLVGWGLVRTHGEARARVYRGVGRR